MIYSCAKRNGGDGIDYEDDEIGNGNSEDVYGDGVIADDVVDDAEHCYVESDDYYDNGYCCDGVMFVGESDEVEVEQKRLVFGSGTEEVHIHYFLVYCMYLFVGTYPVSLNLGCLGEELEDVNIVGSFEYCWGQHNAVFLDHLLFFWDIELIDHELTEKRDVENLLK